MLEVLTYLGLAIPINHKARINLAWNYGLGWQRILQIPKQYKLQCFAIVITVQYGIK
jgi:hypothetical protein